MSAHDKVISNFATVGCGKDAYRERTSIGDIVKQVHAVGDEQPVVVGGQLGYVAGDEGSREFVPISSTDELFSWLEVRVGARIQWARGSAQLDGEAVATVSKSELLAGLRQAPAHRYQAIERWPHDTPMRNSLYLNHVEPEASGAFDDFVNMFNPASDIDRRLLAAAALTPGWGNTRSPLLVLTSTHGIGAGKSSAANAIAELWGGSIKIGVDSRWERVMSDLLSPGALQRRIVVMDNVKSEIDIGGLEDVLTSEVVAGHALYRGHAERPNSLVWLLAENAPALSADLAARSVVIKLGAPVHSRPFRAEMDAFLAKRRPRVIAAALHILLHGERHTLSSDRSDRFQEWQQAVLCTQPSPGDLADAIRARRAEYDQDAVEMETLQACVAQLSVDCDGFISTSQVANAFSNALERSVNARDLRQLVGKHGYRLGLEEHRKSDRRGYVVLLRQNPFHSTG